MRASRSTDSNDAAGVGAGSDITLAEAREALRAAHGTSVASTGGVSVIDPQRAREVVEGATESMMHAIHTLSLVMAAVPIAAIILALVLLRPANSANPD